MAKLVLLGEGFSGRTYELKVDRTTVGRLPDNAFEIPEGSVSSHHAEILLKGSDILIRDLDSTNGTFINGEKIAEAVLKPGQILRFGTVELRLETGDGPSEKAPTSPGTRKPQQVHDQTRVIPQGVKLDELEGAKAPLNFDTNKAFSKKSNKGNKIFIAIAVVVGCLLVVLLALAVFKRAG